MELAWMLGITALAGVGGTGLGGAAGCLLRRESSRAISLLLSFAAGVMVAVVCFDLLTDALTPAPDGNPPALLVLAGVLIGYGAVDALNRLLSRGPEIPEGRGGLLLAGLVMAAAIALHNVPEGMAVSAPMISGGMPKPKAAAAAAATGAPTVLGAALGYAVGALGPRMLAAALSFASGAMLYVVFGELLPEANGLWRSRAPALAAVVGILVGMLVVLL